MPDTPNTTEPPKSRRRRFHATPDRLIVGLLALAGVLLLAEQFRWFPKGWTVLIGVACAGAALLFLSIWFAASQVFRWRFQLSIRSLLLLVVVASILCSWIAVEKAQADKQRRVVEAVKKLDVGVAYDFQLDDFARMKKGAALPEPAWLINLLGKDFFADVISVGFQPDATDARMACLKDFNQLKWLYVFGTGITDAGLVNIEHLSRLQYLIAWDTKITDAGLIHVKEVAQLRGLHLSSTKVTDKGLLVLEGLTQLHTLALENDDITDAGLEHLTGLTQLARLGLGGTHVTKAGLEKLQQALPNCKIY